MHVNPLLCAMRTGAGLTEMISGGLSSDSPP